MTRNHDLGRRAANPAAAAALDAWHDQEDELHGSFVDANRDQSSELRKGCVVRDSNPEPCGRVTAAAMALW
jgi:hypothetical protein